MHKLEKAVQFGAKGGVNYKDSEFTMPFESSPI